MNCQTIQRRLLGVEDPGQPPPEVQAHLDGCPPCREWQARLVQVEQAVRVLPVPPPRSRAAFVRRLLQPESVASAAPTTPVPERTRPETSKPKPVIRRIPGPTATAAGVPFPWRLWAGATAAALLLFAFTFWGVRDPVAVHRPAPKERSDPLVATLVKHDLRLASARENRERVEALKAIAQELHREQLSLEGASDTNELVQDFSDWYRQVDAASAKLSDLPVVNVVTSTPAPPAADAGRVQQLRRNHGLIRELVLAGLRLAAEEELFKRVECCSALARTVAAEIRSASDNQEVARAVEMGHHFSDLMTRGIADNLRLFRGKSPPGSAFEQQIRSLGKSVEEFTDPLVEYLEERSRPATSGGELRTVLAAVQKGCRAVQGAIKV